MALPQVHEPDAPVPFGKYELLGLLGSGGMAEVFLARARGPMGFERRVVVKRILPHLSRDEEFVAMFVEEAKLSAALSHGNIVHVYDFGEVDGQLFLAMEHVDGADLRSLARRARLAGEPLAPELIVFVAIEVLSALAYAHERTDAAGRRLELVHRDVSPSNILLSAAGEVKLCDFGIAKIAARHTSTGRLKGKFGYMSPEQANGDPVDARTDLWAVGVMLWELLTGRKLFQADSDVGVLNQVSRGAIPELPRVGVANETALRAVIGRALVRDTARRYQDATTMAEDLRDFLVDARLADPQRLLREAVRKFGGPSVRPAARSAPVAEALPTEPRIVVPEGPTELIEPGTAPSASAIVPVRRRSLGLVIAGALLALAVLTAAAIALWPSTPTPVPHAMPGWSPRGASELPPLPPLPRRPVAPATASTTAEPPAPSPSPETETQSDDVRASSGSEARTPNPNARWQPTRTERRSDSPSGGREASPIPQTQDRAATRATEPRVETSSPARPSRESTVDPFAIH